MKSLIESVVLFLIVLMLGALLYIGESYSIEKICAFHKANFWPEPAWREKCKGIVSDP